MIPDILTYIPVPAFLITNENFEIQDCNSDASEFIGVDREELKGISLKKYLPDYCFDERIERETVPFRISEKSDKIGELILREIPERPGTLLVTFTENEPSEEKTKFKELMNGTTEGILVVNKRLAVVDVNQALCKMLEISRGDIIGRNGFALANKFLNMKNIKRVAPALKNMLIGKSVKEFEIEYQDKILAISSAISRGTKYYVAIVRDITRIKKHQKAIRESEELYRKLFQTSRDAIMTLEPPDWRFTSGNESIFNIFGVSSHSEFTGLEPWEISPQYQPDGRLSKDKAIEHINDALENGYKYFSWIHKKKSGEEFNATVLLTRVDLHNKTMLQATVRDVTEEEKAKEEISRLTFAVNQTPTPIAIFDSQGRFIYVNNSFNLLTGYQEEDLIGREYSVLQTETDSQEEIESIIKKVSKGQVWEGETISRRKSGKEYLEHTSIAPVFDSRGKITHFIRVSQDITQQRKLEKELIAAKDKAEESDRLKSAFLANMSHEIRTPMNGILGFTELLRQPDLSGEQHEKFVDIIKKSGERMLNTVNDLIEISKIETGQVNVNLRPVNINDKLDHFLRFFEREATAKGLRITMHSTLPTEDAIIDTDESKFNSIMTNLLKNAVKYTSEGGIEFGYSLKEKNGTEILEFFVKDSGIGIPKNRQKAIFRRFEQADIEDTNAFEGSGLGLTITKAYVVLLGGNIHVESEEGSGATFIFELPYQQVDIEVPATEIPMSETERDKTGMKILLVDDERISMEYLDILLEDYESDIFYARNGVEAVEVFEENPDIELILMDMKMPLLDGFKATKMIRKADKKVIIIAQTAYAFESDKQKALDAGCDDYISKPIKKTELFDKIEKLRRQQAARTSEE